LGFIFIFYGCIIAKIVILWPRSIMNLRDYLKGLRQEGRRCFTLKEMVFDNQISKNAALNAIHRAKVQGDLISPARGLYVIVPPEHQVNGCIPPEELVPILMSYLKSDYYVSLLSGAQYYGASHQKPGRFQVISNMRIRRLLEFGNVKIEMIYKKSLNDLPTQDVVVSTGYLKVASPELVAIDLFLYPEKSGGLNHIATVLSELVEAIETEKLLSLAEKVSNNACLQRLGYVLDHIDTMDPQKTQKLSLALAEYLSGRIKIFVPLASELQKVGVPRIKKWMIIENTNLESDL